MRAATAVLIFLGALSACGRQSTSPPPHGDASLDPGEKIVRATLGLLAADGKPVCVQPETFGSPLSIWKIATEGKLQKDHDLAWFAPKPFRTPEQPTLGELRRSVRAGEKAGLIEPGQRRDRLPAELQSSLQAEAAALAAPSRAAHHVTVRPEWAPKGVALRWWPGGANPSACTAQYVLSEIKWNARVAFVGVRVEHWGTIFALAPQGNDWRPIAQWGTWLY